MEIQNNQKAFVNICTTFNRSICDLPYSYTSTLSSQMEAPCCVTTCKLTNCLSVSNMASCILIWGEKYQIIFSSRLQVVMRITKKPLHGITFKETKRRQRNSGNTNYDKSNTNYMQINLKFLTW